MTTLQELKNRRRAILEKIRGIGGEDSIMEDGVGMDIDREVGSAKTVNDISELFAKLFSINSDDARQAVSTKPVPQDKYKGDKTPFGLKQTGRKYREKINQQCKEILARVGDDRDNLTPEDYEILKQYSGRGNTDEGSFYEYYTPTYVAEGVWDMMRAHGFENGNVLEPCTGAGVFIATKPKGVLVTGSELSDISSKVAQLLNPEDTVHSEPFEDLVMSTPDNTFDGCVTNVPFGDVRGAHQHIDPAHKHLKQIDQYFITRIIDKLKPGKLACIIVPISTIGRGTASGKYQEWRTAISKKAEFLGAHKFPSDTFTSYGTSAVIDVMVLRKHPQEMLDKIPNLPHQTLVDANVIWKPFIDGKYWQTPEGKKMIMGKYTPKPENGTSWDREKVEGNLSNVELKKKLAKRLNSRINWEMLEVAEPIPRNYAEGDRRVINGDEYEMSGGTWVKIAPKPVESKISREKYGSVTIEELKDLLSHPKTALKLSLDQAFSAMKDYPDTMTKSMKDAITFAMSQGKTGISEQLYRGSIIGAMISGYSNATNDPAVDVDDSEREALLDIVGREIDKYGHPLNNKNLRLTGDSSRNFGLFANAYDIHGNPSDLLSGTLEKPMGDLQFDSSNAQAVVEHLFHREGIQNIELDDFLKIYTGPRKVKALGDIADDDSIAITADGHLQPINRYTSGDIYPKVNAITEAMANEDDKRIVAKFQKQIDLINKRRKKTDPETISFSFQQKWFPRKYILEFLREEWDSDLEYGRWEDQEIEDRWSGETSVEPVFVRDMDSPFGEFSVGNKLTGFDNYFLKYLNGDKMSGRSVKDDDGTVIKDAPGSPEDNKRILREMEESFNAWMKQHPDIDEVGEKFNQKFNGFIDYESDGSDLGIDISERFKLHNYQNAAIRRLSEDGRGCLAFDVGLGKTITALGLCEYNRKLGRAKKTCIVVPNSVVGNWYQESKAFLGHHNNVLFVGFEPKRDKNGDIVAETVLDENGEPKLGRDGEPIIQDVLMNDDLDSVYKKMWSIPTTNLSIVIMSEERYAQIPMKLENKMAYADKMVERSLINESSAMGALDTGDAGEGKQIGGQSEDGGKPKKMTYEEHKARIRAEGKFSDDGTRKRNEFPYFEDMGFDSVIVDEAHHFKNLYAPKSERKIKYLSEGNTAKRSLDMAMKTNYMRDMGGGRGAYLLTATPVTNSAFETYSMLSYICGHEEFDKFGIYTVDDFIRVFGNIDQVTTIGMDGDEKTVDALVGFRNLDGLRSMLNRFVNMKTAADYPDQIKLPPSDHIDEEVELDEEQARLYEGLRIDAKEAMKKAKSSPGAILKVLRQMDRLTTDIDMYKKQMTFIFRESDRDNVMSLLDNMPKHITVTREVKEDPSDPDEKPKKEKVKIEFTHEIIDGESDENFKLIVGEDFVEGVVSRLKANKINSSDATHPVTPKYAKLIENLKKEHDAAGKQIIFTEEKTQHGKIERLIVHHIPVDGNMVGIINADEAKGKKLQQISDSYNSGKIKIIIANQKAEVGVNLQRGTTAIHHLTFPWTPASIQQRNGRGIRQGNTAKHINVYYYQGRNSIDSYRLDILRGKDNWLQPLFFGEDNDMSYDTGDDDYGAMLAANKEEYQQERLKKLQAAAEKEKETDKKRTLNTLSQIIGARDVLNRLDESKEKDKADVEGKIESEKTRVEKIRAKLQDETDDEKIKKLTDQLTRAQGNVGSYGIRLEKINSKYEKIKTDKEKQIRKNVGILKAKARKGELPFNEKLIDKPEDGLVTTDGRVFCVGEFYEINGADKVADGSVYKITAVDGRKRTFEIENVTGTRLREGRPIKATQFKPENIKQVSYSQEEIALKKAISEPRRYSDLADGTIPRSIWEDYKYEINFEAGIYLVRGDNGEIRAQRAPKFSSVADEQRKKGIDMIVFPDISNDDFKKEVSEKYLDIKRSDDSGRYDFESVLWDIFGSEWRSTVMIYGKNATESDVRIACQRVINKKLESMGSDTSALDKIRAVDYSRSEIREEAVKLGDNTEEIGRMVNLFLQEVREGFEKDAWKESEEAERKKLEEIKNHPDYKEVPEDIQKAFNALGITVKTNTTTVTNPGYRNYSDIVMEPFSRWFLQDKNGKNGNLFKIKDILKARYATKDVKVLFINTPTGEIQGHVPSSVDLSEIYKLVA